MKKVTYDTLPEAVAELLERVGQIEKLLTEKSPVKKTKKNKTSKPAKVKESRVENKDLLTVQEASKFLNISVNNLYSYVKNNKIPFKKEKRRVYFSKTELENWNKDRNNKKQPASNDAITVKEAVKLLNVPAPRLYYHIKTKKIPVLSKKGNKLYYAKQSLVDEVSKVEKKRKRKTKEA